MLKRPKRPERPGKSGRLRRPKGSKDPRNPRDSKDQESNIRVDPQVDMATPLCKPYSYKTPKRPEGVPTTKGAAGSSSAGKKMARNPN